MRSNPISAASESPRHLVPGEVAEVIKRLKHARANYLQDLPSAHIIACISEVSQRWLRIANDPHERARELIAAETGLSPEMTGHVLADFFSLLNERSLRAMIDRELGEICLLDQFVGLDGHIRSLASGPNLTTIFLGRGHPALLALSLTVALLSKSACILKPPSKQVTFAALFLKTLLETDWRIGSAVLVAAWMGGDEEIESRVLEESDCVIVYGTNDTVCHLRSRVSEKSRFIAFPERSGMVMITQSGLKSFGVNAAAKALAYDVSLVDQRTCLSPLVAIIEDGCYCPARVFADILADELEQLSSFLPRGAIPASAALKLEALRNAAEFRSYTTASTEIRASRHNPSPWLVILTNDAGSLPRNPGYRSVILSRCKDLKDAVELVASFEPAVSTIGVCLSNAELSEISSQLAKERVARICPIGKMLMPPMNVFNDGVPRLSSLLRWTDIEV